MKFFQGDSTILCFLKVFVAYQLENQHVGEDDFAIEFSLKARMVRL